MGELKPCPFCGGEAELHEITFGEKRFFIDCSNGECPVLPQTDSFGYKEPAIHVWNTRQSPKAMIAEGLISFDKERGYIILHRCGCLDKIPDNLGGDIIFSYSSPLEGYKDMRDAEIIINEVCKPEQEG